MTNASVVLIYLTAIALDGSLLIFSLRTRKGMDLRAYYAILSTCLLLWLIPNMLMFILPDLQHALFANELKYLGCAFSPVALLVFTMRFLRMERLISFQTVLLLAIVPIITAILAATNSLHHLFRQEIVLIDSSLRHTEKIQGIWFWVHTGYSYILSMLTIFIMITRIRRTARPYRLPMVILLVGILLSLSGNVVTMFIMPNTSLDFTLLGFSIGMIFLYWSMEHSKMNDFLTLARDEIFQSMRDAVFILDGEYRLLLLNSAATQLCHSVGITLGNGDSFDLFMDGIATMGGRISDNRWGQNMDVTVPLPGEIRTFSIEEHPFTDLHQNHIGSFITLSDVTQIRSLIQKLEKTAGLDALTGIFNRLSYEENVALYDAVDYLPLCVIMGDLNNLKETNDEFGHEAGDDLLRAIASLLLGCLPSGGSLFRIGGDEFAILLPNTSEAAGQAVMRHIQERTRQPHEHPYVLSIALGCACRSDIAQDVHEVIALADQRMYQNKSEGKAAGK